MNKNNKPKQRIIHKGHIYILEEDKKDNKIILKDIKEYVLEKQFKIKRRNGGFV